jgi:hypothetical protein
MVAWLTPTALLAFPGKERRARTDARSGKTFTMLLWQPRENAQKKR